jgi:hypothetical protein
VQAKLSSYHLVWINYDSSTLNGIQITYDGPEFPGMHAFTMYGGPSAC